MIDRSRRFLPLLAVLAFSAARVALADPIGELAGFSAFKEVNLEKLAAGTVQSARGPAISFPRGLVVESVYVVKKPVQKTVDLHLQWNPAKHPELKVLMQGDLSPHPAAAEFEKISAAPASGPVKALAAATQKLGQGSTALQLSHAEANEFDAAASGPGGALPPPVVAYWSRVLSKRTQAFLSGGAGHLPPYETGGETVRPGEDATRLLKEAEKIRSQFAPLLDANAVTGSKTGLMPSLYWTLVDVEGEAALGLGAVYNKKSAGGWQILDAQYYASGGYYVLLTLLQLWPVTVGGQEATLVWRGDLLSSASLANLHGVERMGSSTAMMRETKKSIEVFLKDIATAP